jgi:hypothetical protein
LHQAESYIEGTAIMSGGILVTKGVTFGLSGFSFGMNQETGEITANLGDPKLHYDVCPVWLEIAIGHLKDAKEARTERLAAYAASDDKVKYGTLEPEFRSSMQAITSAAIAVDGFYAVVQSKLDKTSHSPEKWRDARANRWARISETLKVAFQIDAGFFETMRDGLKQAYDFRDRAVHPTGRMDHPVLHPDLSVGVEPRLVTYRYDNAFGIVQFAVILIDELATRGKARNEALKKYGDALKASTNILRADPLLALDSLPLES